MTSWLRRLRGVFGMGLTWAVGWAVVGGAIMEGIVDPHGRLLDMWPQTLAIPGFLGGLTFGTLLWLAEGRRRFEELSVPRLTGWGALVGLLLGVLAVTTGMGREVLPFWSRAFVLVTPLTLSGALSASATLAVARVAARRERLPFGGLRTIADGEPA
ncbi:MAG: hypothetical protein ACK5XT_10090 [Gemmatimonas sp.]|jgi:hypothetical protein|uniref:hypothetical protein n=1 Tax=Gemmatimonas sp. TaxID=1962908 RepID=UPI00391F480E|nr:hypothetical protein [Gemmatimonadota bacterium]